MAEPFKTRDHYVRKQNEISLLAGVSSNGGLRHHGGLARRQVRASVPRRAALRRAPLPRVRARAGRGREVTTSPSTRRRWIRRPIPSVRPLQITLILSPRLRPGFLTRPNSSVRPLQQSLSSRTSCSPSPRSRRLGDPSRPNSSFRPSQSRRQGRVRVHGAQRQQGRTVASRLSVIGWKWGPNASSTRLEGFFLLHTGTMGSIGPGLSSERAGFCHREVISESYWYYFWHQYKHLWSIGLTKIDGYCLIEGTTKHLPRKGAP